MAPMKPSIEAQPWFLPFFLVAWVAAMTYVTAYLAMAVRYRRLTGQEPSDWVSVFFDPATRHYFRWMFTDQHRAVGDAGLSRHVYWVRGLFLVAAILMAAFFLAIFTPR